MIEEAACHPEHSRGVPWRNLKALEYSRAYQQSYLLSLSPEFLDFAALRSE